jgi:protein-S-isoprenylcysteine O-methyltransferase Ste14
VQTSNVLGLRLRLDPTYARDLAHSTTVSAMRLLFLPPRLVLMLLVAMGALHMLLPGPTLLAFPYTLVGAAVAALGFALTLSGARLFARVGTNIRTFNQPGVLVTDGPFRWSRNPIYLGFVVLLLGTAILLGTATPFIAPALFALIADRWYIAFEERAMRERFGADYAAYASRTRRWL